MSRTFPRWVLIQAISNINLEGDARIRDDYSGRGTYNRACFGVVVPLMRDALRLAAALGMLAGAQTEADDDSELETLVTGLMRSAHCDRMGHDAILYFDGWTLS